MMARHSSIRAALFLLIAALPSLATADPLIGTPSGGGSTYQWSVVVNDYDRIVLRVFTPDEDLVARSFAYGVPVVFQLSDLPASPAPAGEYTWELRLIPNVSQAVRNQLAAARAAGDDKLARQIMIAAGIYVPILQNGTFRVINGAIVQTGATEEDANDLRIGDPSTEATLAATGATGPMRNREPVAEDVVVLDDLIVDGSACIGFDCVNGEVFGFDTIRLKENNLRIKFEDTSTTAGFPTNDWQIVANDSASGGASKFSVEDVSGEKTPLTIKAGANTNSIFVDSGGRVGFRTSTPVLDLHVSTSNTPGIRFEQTSAGGFSAQTWDIASNETSFFIRDVTGGSSMPFRIRPGAPSSSIDISDDGEVGIGTASPTQLLDVDEGNIQLDIGYYLLWGGSWGIIQQAGTYNLEFVQGTARMALTTAGNVGIGTTAPSSKLHVNGGDIRVSGGSIIDDGVTLTVPDYVFEDSYRLMSIPELAKFIREEKHLPNVPSASEIAAGGLNVGKFQMSLLEKIEELTLYTIALQEEVSALKAKLEQ